MRSNTKNGYRKNWSGSIDYNKEGFCTKCQVVFDKSEAPKDKIGRIVCSFCSNLLRLSPRENKARRRFGSKRPYVIEID